jgi:hypothetical protein
MAKTQNVKSKDFKMADIRAHLFINVHGNNVDVIYNDDLDNGAGLGAALVSILGEDKKLMSIISAALLTALENKEDLLTPLKKKYSSKTDKKPVKKATKAVNKK